MWILCGMLAELKCTRLEVNSIGGTVGQVGVRASGGLRLWDIRFLGERIVYELSLQEILASYSGITPATVSAFSMGCPRIPVGLSGRTM